MAAPVPLAPLAPLLALDDAVLASLASRLRTCGLTPEAVADTEDVLPGLPQFARDPLVRRSLERRGGAAATLLAMFVYGHAVTSAAATEALGAPLVAALRGALLEDAGDGAHLRSAFVLMPIGAQWFLSDPLHAGAEAVMGPGMTTFLLHEWSARFPAARVLDLGCGAGSLAIAAAARGAHAVATDLSPRAVAMARLNARLNGVALDARESDLGGALADERFDLVLSQPPYVARPASAGATTYLHGGAYGDELALRFVTESARRIAPGGVALVLFDFALREGARLAERLHDALGAEAVSQLAIVRRGSPPDLAALHYGGSHHASPDAAWERSVREYRDHFDALGISGFSSVLLVLQRPVSDADARPRLVIEHTGRRPPSPAALRALWDGVEAAARAEDALLASRISPAPEAAFVASFASPADESPLALRVELPDGAFATNRELGDRGWLLFGLLDGSRTLAEVAAAFADACDAPPDAARAEVLAFAREGLARGLLREAR